jgi:dolichyl-diphosphooligosaccharide--protein glycosyltransferase
MGHKGRAKRRKALMRHRQQEIAPRERKWLWPALIGAVVLGAFLIRVVPQIGIVLVNGGVEFKEVDPWYHMRLVDNMVHNFPLPLTYDVYSLYPDGAEVGFQPLLTWLIVAIGYVVSLGQPSTHTVELIGAFLPPIMGALICLPVYLIGREMGGKVVGIVAAFLVAILPTQLLFRSLLGFTDHHVFEVLLATTTAMFLLFAVARGRLRHAAFAGVAFGLYLLNWHGAVFFVFVLWLWFVIQFFYEWRRGGDLAYLAKVGIVAFGLATLIFAPYLATAAMELLPKVLMLCLALITPPMLLLASRLVKSWRRGVVLVAGAGCLGLAAACAVDLRMVLHALLLTKAIFSGFGTTIAEAKPSSLPLFIQNYGVCFVLFLAGFILAVVKRQSPLIIVWSLVLFIAMVGQRRWGYYFAINASLLSAYFLWWAVSLIRQELRLATVGFCCVIVIAFPLVGSISDIVKAPNHITPGWHGAMVWIRENTPDPLPVGSYYAKSATPQPDYSVLAWWDYGHWITRIAQRVPLASPSHQLGNEIGGFFVAQNIEDAEAAIEGMNVRYVVIDGGIMTGKFHALVSYANRYREGNFLEPYNAARENLKVLRDGSMMARIYNGQADGYVMVYEKEDVRVFERLKGGG